MKRPARRHGAFVCTVDPVDNKSQEIENNRKRVKAKAQLCR
jgi:hypothetical protein